MLSSYQPCFTITILQLKSSNGNTQYRDQHNKLHGCWPLLKSISIKGKLSSEWCHPPPHSDINHYMFAAYICSMLEQNNSTYRTRYSDFFNALGSSCSDRAAEQGSFICQRSNFLQWLWVIKKLLLHHLFSSEQWSLTLLLTFTAVLWLWCFVSVDLFCVLFKLIF